MVHTYGMRTDDDRWRRRLMSGLRVDEWHIWAWHVWEGALAMVL